MFCNGSLERVDFLFALFQLLQFGWSIEILHILQEILQFGNFSIGSCIFADRQQIHAQETHAVANLTLNMDDAVNSAGYFGLHLHNRLLFPLRNH